MLCKANKDSLAGSLCSYLTFGYETVVCCDGTITEPFSDQRPPWLRPWPDPWLGATRFCIRGSPCYCTGQGPHQSSPARPSQARPAGRQAVGR